MSKLSGIISKGFKSEKCKVSLRMAMARIKLLRNKRDAQIKQMRRDVAQLLESGQDQTARIRVEHVIREEKTMAAYELIELYCELIIARLPIIDSQKNCPLDLKEAITSVIFASPRCADVAELMDIRKQFVSKYGKEFATCALELRPNSGVSPLVIEKLSAKAPDLETKVKTLTSIAEEHNVNWDSKELLEQIQNPKKDLISGSTHFPSASQFYSDSYSSNVQASFEPQNNEPQENILHQQNLPIPPQEYSSPQFEPNSAESSLREEEEEKAEHKYKSAKDAARAAAESAERAHLAALAAAELANRKNTTKSEEFPPQNVHKEEKEEEEEEEINVAMFDRADSDDNEDRSVFELYEETDFVDSFSDKKKEESSRFEGEYSSHFGFSSRDKEESSRYANNSSGPTYDSDGISSEDENENENAKKMESLSIYDDEEKEHAQISYEDDDNEEGVGFNFGKLRCGLKNKPHQNQPLYVRKSIFNDDGDLRSDKESKGYADSSSDEEERNEALNDEKKKKNKSSGLKEGKTGIIEESSSESSNASLHVHPRLPSDYDSFAAHFQSLRSNRP